MLSHSTRQQLRLEHASANYGVINPHTLELVSIYCHENHMTLLT